MTLHVNSYQHHQQQHHNNKHDCRLINRSYLAVFKHQTNYVSLGDAGIGWIVLLLTVQGVIFLLVLRWRGSRLLPLPWGKWLGCLLPQEPVLAQRRMTSRTRMFADDVDVEMERWRIGSKVTFM